MKTSFLQHAEQEGIVTREEFDRWLQQAADIVEAHVSDPATLEAIGRDWREIIETAFAQEQVSNADALPRSE